MPDRASVPFVCYTVPSPEGPAIEGASRPWLAGVGAAVDCFQIPTAQNFDSRALTHFLKDTADVEHGDSEELSNDEQDVTLGNPGARLPGLVAVIRELDKC